MNALLALARADVVMYLSNRRALLVTLAAPILIAAFFGSVLGGPPKKPLRVPIAVVDLDTSAVSKKIVAAMKDDSSFEIQELAEPAAIALVRAGKVRAAVVVPAGFGDLAPQALFRPDVKKPEIAVHYDPSQSVTLSLVKGLLAQHVVKAVSSAAFGPEAGLKVIADARADAQKSAGLDEAERRDLLSLFDSLERLQGREKRTADGKARQSGMQGFSLPFETKEVEVTSGKDTRYNGYAHAFAGMGVQFILFMGIELGMAVLLMRRQGIWKRLRAAPLSRAMLLGSRIVSGTVIACLLLAGIYAAALAFFGVRVEGSLAGFAGVGLAFAVLTATFGLLIAALGRTPEATRGIAIVSTLLLVMLGGAWVPTFVFPEWMQTATLVVPTRWAIDGLEAMTWRGLGFDAALAPIGVMLAFSVAFGWIAVKRFNWDE
jgi:ABC-2 type transport system permease protein